MSDARHRSCHQQILDEGLDPDLSLRDICQLGFRKASSQLKGTIYTAHRASSDRSSSGALLRRRLHAGAFRLQFRTGFYLRPGVSFAFRDEIRILTMSRW